MAIDELQIERLALGELSPSEEAALRARMQTRMQAAGGRSLEQRLAEIASSDAAILGAHPPARAAAVIGRRLADAKTKRSSWWMVGPAIAATAVVLLIIRSQEPLAAPGSLPPTIDEHRVNGHSTANASEIRLKGSGPRLVLYRQATDQQEGAERLREGQEVSSGDVLQVSYIAAGATAGVILSIDGRGITTLHYPAAESPPPYPLEQGAAVPLDSAYELDDAPTFERFFFVTSQGPPLSADVVTRAAESLAAEPTQARNAPLPLPPEFEQHSFLLRKSEQPGAAGASP